MQDEEDQQQLFHDGSSRCRLDGTLTVQERLFFVQVLHPKFYTKLVGDAKTSSYGTLPTLLNQVGTSNEVTQVI